MVEMNRNDRLLFPERMKHASPIIIPPDPQIFTHMISGNYFTNDQRNERIHNDIFTYKQLAFTDQLKCLLLIE